MQESNSSDWLRQQEKAAKKVKTHECGCGKKYKAASSLGTHVKIVHNGIAPTVPNPNEPARPSRGRPKQYQYKQLQGIAINTVNPLVSLRESQEQLGVSEINVQEIYQKEPVFGLITRFVEQQEEDELSFIKEDKIYNVTMGRGLAILLQELRIQVQNEQLYHELVLLITIYISYVIDETEDQNVLSNGSIGLLPEFANIFILYDLSKRCERLKLGNLWITSPQRTMEVLSTLFNWLTFKKFTYTIAIINQEFLQPSQEITQTNKGDREQQCLRGLPEA